MRAWSDALVLPTYLPAAPDRHPMFLEQRVYQGSSGRVYPLPFTDRIAERPVDRSWRAVWIENEYLRVLILPELGGRIHRILDLTTGYDLVYYQPVIKPALVGLAGPWISGGIEFNWPQHHRPATFLPVEVEIERDPDGSVTVWCGDHDPMSRMKGTHGVCLHPGRAVVELKARVFNRTPFVQTFLWWANVATRVHAAYQSFFPPDVHCVADHARRSMSTYPLAQGRYYGVDYAARARTGVPPGEVPSRYQPPHPPGAGASALPASATRYPVSGIRYPASGSAPPYAPNDLSFYANIPVPTSYMCVGSREDFFGGYDFRAGAGLVHIANHHIAPGKKQWTWGNHEFGYAWDRNLTDPDARGECAPYIELMAGVYTDNQPDFSFLQPGETRAWSQYWYPIHGTGPVQQATVDAAAALTLEKRRFRVAVSVTREFPRARIRLERADGRAAAEWRADLAPGRPWILESRQAREPWKPGDTVLRVLTREGDALLRYAVQEPQAGAVPAPATEPPPPDAIASVDELFVTGLHLEQYRHATRCPTLYWREALRRDSGDSRCNNAVGLWHLRRGEFRQAEAHFRSAIERLTRRNANPYDGEPFYHLGLCLRFQADTAARSEVRGSKSERNPRAEASEATGGSLRRTSESGPPSDPGLRTSDRLSLAYDAFYKATWNQAWAGAAFHALAEIDCRRRDWTRALEHCERAAHAGGGNPRLFNLWAMAVAREGNRIGAESMLRLNRAHDPLDWWTRHLLGEPLTCDLQTCLDIAHDLARAGFDQEAVTLLEAAEKRDRRSDLPTASWGALPLVRYTLGWLHERLAAEEPADRGKPADSRSRAAGRHERHRLRARRWYARAAATSPDYCFPARIEEIAVLEAARRADPRDAQAAYLLGNLLYDRRRHEEAIGCWETCVRLDPGNSVAWRNLGMAYFNIRHQPARARAAYDRALRAAPDSARLLYERDQLWRRLGVSPARRLQHLLQRRALVEQRDDLSLELCALFNQTGRPREALEIVSRRQFQPWEGGEGGPLGQWTRTHLALGRQALAGGDAAGARRAFEAALTAPANLGEARHLLANQSDVHYWLGCACAATGDRQAARRHWRAAAAFRGDFQEMRVRSFSEMTFWSALAWRRLGREDRARALFESLRAHARELARTPARIDYFATSLPTLLLFTDDVQSRQDTTAMFLEAQALIGLGRRAAGKRRLREVLRRDPAHPYARDLLEFRP